MTWLFELTLRRGTITIPLSKSDIQIILDKKFDRAALCEIENYLIKSRNAISSKIIGVFE